MRQLPPAEVAWRSDKSHIDWAFNRVSLAWQLAMDDDCRLEPQAAY